MKSIISFFLLLICTNIKSQIIADKPDRSYSIEVLYSDTQYVNKFNYEANKVLDSIAMLYEPAWVVKANNIWKERYYALYDLWNYCIPQIRNKKKFKEALKHYRELMQ